MDRVHRSRVDWWIALLLLLPLAGGGATAIATGRLIGGAAVLLYIGILAGLVLPVRYVLSPERGLTVRSGLLRTRIPWDRLASAARSRNPISSPALSLRRLEIQFRTARGGGRSVYISPADRDRFLADLVELSPRHRRDGARVVEG